MGNTGQPGTREVRPGGGLRLPSLYPKGGLCEGKEPMEPGFGIKPRFKSHLRTERC